jgi:hypothetical protein
LSISGNKRSKYLKKCRKNWKIAFFSIWNTPRQPESIQKCLKLAIVVGSDLVIWLAVCTNQSLSISGHKRAKYSKKLSKKVKNTIFSNLKSPRVSFKHFYSFKIGMRLHSDLLNKLGALHLKLYHYFRFYSRLSVDRFLFWPF